MRRLVQVALVCSLAFAAPGAGHASGGNVTGMIAIGNPAYPMAGIALNGAPCSASSPLNGTDGRWVNVNGHAGHAAALTPDLIGGQKAPADFDVWFYTGSCGFIDNDDFAQGDGVETLPYPYTQLGDTETGTIPSGSVWALIVLWTGAGATYRFTY